jgi:hypothetical protein
MMIKCTIDWEKMYKVYLKKSERIEKELTTLKASIPKIKADAVLSLIEAIEGAIDNDFISIKEVEEMHLEDFCGLAKRHANKLEAGE